MNNKVCVITGASKYNAEFSKEDILQHLSAKVGNTMILQVLLGLFVIMIL